MVKKNHDSGLLPGFGVPRLGALLGGTTPSFLSAMETGRKKVPAEWVAKIEHHFAVHGVSVANLGAAADASNQSVSLEGLTREHQMLVAGFARVQSSSMSSEDVDAFKRLLQGLQGDKKK